MVRAALVATAVAAFLSCASTARAEVTQLFPGATYESAVQFTPHGPVAINVVRGPRPVGLYGLHPVLSNESVTRLESVTSMQRRLAPQATTVGINGDFYSFADGRPSGIVLRDGALVNAPNANRSSAGIEPDGTLDVRRVKFLGTWRGLGQQHRLNAFNDAPPANGIAIFTRDWGSATPRVDGSLAVTLSPFPPATPNDDIVATVASVTQSPSVPIASGTAVLVARGSAAQRLSVEAPLGTTVTSRLILQPDWTAVSDAIGGGPVLVRDGAPVFHANEAFTTSQLAPRNPRSAVGQLADGRIVLVAVDGRQAGYSVGMTNFELAQTLVRLGAVRAMAFDGGGSTTLAFDGKVLNHPSEGRERPVSTALMLLYSGVYAPPPAVTVASPNGDGVDERQALAYKVVRPSTVTATLTAPDGTAYAETVQREPGTYVVPFPPTPPPPPPPPAGELPPIPPPPPVPIVPGEGRWTLTVSATDDLAETSSATRRFWLNSTLGFLRVAPRTLRLPPRGAMATIAWQQTRAGRVTVALETRDGIVLRRLANRAFGAGALAVTWDGRLKSRRLAPTGAYVIRVTARNDVGVVSLERDVRVRRIAGKKPARPRG